MRRTLLLSALLVLGISVSGYAQRRVPDDGFTKQYKFVYSPARATDTTMERDFYGSVPWLSGYSLWVFEAVRVDSGMYRDGVGGCIPLVDSLAVSFYGCRMDTGGTKDSGPTGCYYDSLLVLFAGKDSIISANWPKKACLGDTTYGVATVFPSGYIHDRIKVNFRWAVIDTRDTDSLFCRRPRYEVTVTGIRR